MAQTQDKTEVQSSIWAGPEVSAGHDPATHGQEWASVNLGAATLMFWTAAQRAVFVARLVVAVAQDELRIEAQRATATDPDGFEFPEAAGE